MKKKKSKNSKPEKVDDIYICENCGANVDPNRGMCMRCGAFHNPVQKMMAQKIMKERNLNSVWLSEAPSFKGMNAKEINYDDGLRFLEKMQLNEAVNFYNKAVKENPANHTTWNNLGVAYMGLKERKMALECYERALKLSPSYYIGLYNKGAVYFECQQYQDAIKYFEKVLNLNPKCAEAYWDKHIANERLGKFDFRGGSIEAMKLGLNIMRAQMNRNSALVDLCDGRDAILGYTTLFLKHKGKLVNLFNQAMEYFKQGNPYNALEILAKAIKINPEDPRVWNLQGKVFTQLKNFNEALYCAEMETKIEKFSEEGWLLQGIIHSINKQLDRAIMCFNKVLRINPFQEQAREGKFVFSREYFSDLRRQGKFEQSIKVLDQLLEDQLFEDHLKKGNLWVDKGIVYVEMKNIETAINCFNTALKFDPRNFHAWFNKGGLNLKQGNNTAAFKCFTEALKIRPNDAKALEYRVLALASSKGKTSYDINIDVE